MKVRLLALPLVSFLFILNGCATLGEGGASRLDLIKRRTELRCGVSGKIPGFSFLQRDGSFAGLDVDICRAFAAAFTGSPDQVQYRSLTAPERFTALRTGEIDLLSRNTTFNLSRDAAGGNGVSFAPVVFHDGQGLLVKRSSGISNLNNLKGKTICVGSGTTTEQNLNDAFQAKGIDYKPIKYQDLNQVIAGYLQGRCSAMTSDRSQLAAARSGFNNPDQHVILPEVLSKEPLAPLAAGGDQRLADAMRWVIYALIAAEELGITTILVPVNAGLLSAQGMLTAPVGQMMSKSVCQLWSTLDNDRVVDIFEQLKIEAIQQLTKVKITSNRASWWLDLRYRGQSSVISLVWW